MAPRTNSASHRLRQDYLRLKRDPVPYIIAEPLPTNILEWHYVVTGPEASPYEGGFYHGKLVFPTEFPFKPPSIYMITPNGRFETNKRLCLSISDYHPDTWNPAWSVSTILTGLLSFMLEKSPTYGSIETSDYEKRNLAAKSHAFNTKDKIFCELFPEIVSKSREIVEKRKRDAEKKLNGNSIKSRYGGNGADSLNMLESEGIAGYHGTLTNVLVLGVFAIFAVVVRFVMQSVSAVSD